MSDEPGDFIECAVCGRNILRGERVSEYVTPEREQVSVCALCKTRAEQMGWTQASLAGAPALSDAPRRRGFDLRGRLLGGRRPRRGRGMTADELAREIGIPDPPQREDPDEADEPETERRFVMPSEDEDDETRFPDPVEPRSEEPFVGVPEPDEQPWSGPQPEVLEPGDGEADEEADEEPADHELAEPESFWDERARATRGPAQAAEAEAEAPDTDEQQEGRAPAREPRPAQPRRRSSRGPRRASTEAESTPAASEPPRRQPRTPARLMRTAAENFNASEEARKVGGLMRSLGDPSVSLRPPAREDLPALLTVAWELSWYQWEVGVEPDDASVREIAKGSEISELDDAARRWNARADEDGLIRLRRAGRTEADG